MRHIPNIITCLNLFSGCLACIMALVYTNYQGACFFILLAALFDFLDGFAARMLKAYSPIGAQLDSLADVISFGFAPACIVYHYLMNIVTGMPFGQGISLFAFLIPVFSALRLAKFNIDTRQKDSFIGLPVPANGLFWASCIPALIPFSAGRETLFAVVILGVIIAFCLLMVSEIPMFSLKFKSFGWRENQLQFILILLSILFIVLFGLTGISFSIVTYILLSLIQLITPLKKGS